MRVSLPFASGLASCLLLTLALAASAQATRTNYPPSPYGNGSTSKAPPPPAMPNPTVGSVGNASQFSSPYNLSTQPYPPINIAPSIQVAPTMPMMGGAMGGFNPFWGGGWGWGWGGAGMGLGMALEGQASLTQATGQYWKDIQQARMGREEARRSELDTARARIEFEAWYETMRPTTPKVLARERANELEWARNEPTKTDIWSGRSLNVLLRSIMASPAPTSGPTITLEEHILRGLNLTDRASRGNLTLAKDEGRIFWTEAFEDPRFDEARDRFSKNFEKAIKTSSYGEMPDRAAVREMRDDLNGIERQLEQMASELPPSRFIEARRLVNQLRDTLRGFSDPRLCRSANGNWRRSVQTVAQLVEHCMKNGLEFGPAGAIGDEPAYTAAFFALRAYERAVVPVARGE